jgi:hypothetical protein
MPALRWSNAWLRSGRRDARMIDAIGNPGPVDKAAGATTTSRRFIIYSGGFDENIGGVIALHRLCDLLNREGHEAFLWPDNKPAVSASRPIASRWKLARYRLKGKQRAYKTWPGFITRIAEASHLPGAIAVYPEVVDGNPLGVEHVVRWLLHKPGFHTGRSRFGPRDRFFFYQKAFDDPSVNSEGDNLLKTSFVRDDIYRQTNFGGRRGTCYFLRKGLGREIVHDLADSVLVDDLSHAQLAEVFNRVTTCISYDAYTMYSMFAALCGCDSVVVPEEGATKEQWYPDPADRYGLAYGFDDIDSARSTRHLLLPRLKSQESLANESVLRFVEKCARYFA